MKKWLQQMMVGRSGVDQLSSTLLVTSLLLYTFSLPFNNLILKLVALIFLFISYYRVFSKQVYKRQQENFKFIRFYTPLLKKGRTRLRQLKEFKTHKYFSCPNCHQILRVPRKKGNVTITCPKCKHSFHQHS